MLSPENDTARDVAGVASRLMALAKRHLLVIEDEAGLQKIVRRRAERAGIQVTQALTSAEGFALAMTVQPDLILLDLHLPDGTGIALLRRLKAEPRTADVPVVAWSGSEPTARETEALQAGASAFFDKSAVKRVVESVIELISQREARER